MPSEPFQVPWPCRVKVAEPVKGAGGCSVAMPFYRDNWTVFEPETRLPPREPNPDAAL
jgi:hypothetical protein